MTENHKREVAVLKKTHQFKVETLYKQHERRRLNFKNALMGEIRKVKTVIIQLNRYIVIS